MSKWVLLFSLIMLSPSPVTGQVTADAHDKLITMAQATFGGDVVADAIGDSDFDGNTVAPVLTVACHRVVSEPICDLAVFLPERYQAGPRIRAPPYLLFA